MTSRTRSPSSQGISSFSNVNVGMNPGFGVPNEGATRPAWRGYPDSVFEKCATVLPVSDQAIELAAIGEALAEGHARRL